MFRNEKKGVMRKILFVIVGLILLLFSSNSLADDPYCYSDILATGIPSDIPCVGLLPASKWCKCVVEWNLNNLECVAKNDCEGGGEEGCYLELNECLNEMAEYSLS